MCMQITAPQAREPYVIPRDTLTGLRKFRGARDGFGIQNLGSLPGGGEH